jgi:hypothetical protein
MTVAIPSLPTPPSSTDPVNFDARADAFLAALPTTVTQMNAQNVENNSINVTAAASAATAATQVTLATNQVTAATSQATAAAGHAATALTHATTSAINAGATLWVSGTTYAIGDARYSPITGQTYRRQTAGAGTTDPSADTTNWKPILLDVQTNLPTIRPTLDLNFAQSKTVDPRISFTRASTATYYDGKTTAKAEENLFVYSQDFSNASWPSNLETVVTVNSTVAPDLTSTADLVSATTTSGYHAVRRAYYMTAGLPVMVSIYAKPGAYSKLVMSDSHGGVYTANFDLTLGTVISSQGCSAAITRDAVTGWCRCSLVHSPATSLNRSLSFMGYPDAGATLNIYGAQYVGDDTSGVYLWGAQLEERAFLTEYTPTTTAPITNYIPVLQTAVAGQPRINHDPVTGECLGLLVEGGSSNLLLRSQEFENAAWSKPTYFVKSAAGIAPDGTNTACKIGPTVGTNAWTWGASQIVTKAASVASYTLSVYAKASERTEVDLLAQSVVTAGTAQARFNLLTGTVISVNNSGSFTVVPTTEIQAVGNGWYRVSMSFTSNADASVYSHVYAGFDGFTGDGIQGILVWGAQLEQQQLTTAYIPTTTATVTRNTDVASISSDAFVSFFNNAEGTMFYEANYNKTSDVNASNRVAYALTSGDQNTRFLGYNGGSANTGTGQYAIARSVVSVSQNPGGGIDNLFKKVAHAYRENDFACSANGGVVVSDVYGAVPTVNTLNIGHDSGSAQLAGHIKRLTYYPERLSNLTLQAMTAQ